MGVSSSQCYKRFWSCLPLWTAACLHSISYTMLFFWHPHAKNLLLWSPHWLGIHSHKTGFDIAQPYHLLKPNWKPSDSCNTSASTNSNTASFRYSQCVCVCVCVRACVRACVCVYRSVSCMFCSCCCFCGAVVLFVFRLFVLFCFPTYNTFGLYQLH